MIGLTGGIPRAGRFVVLLALAALIAGCGKSAATSGGTSALAPDTGKRRREMDDFMKGNKPVIAPTGKARNHP